MTTITFYIISAIVLGAAVLMITSRNLVHSVVWMVLSFIGVGALFILLEAEFVAAVQILVYAGGIVVLFLFVVMLVNVGDLNRSEYLHRQWVPASMLTLMLIGELTFLLWGGTAELSTRSSSEQTDAVLRSVGGEVIGNTETIGMKLYTDYLLPFELASVLLLVAMVGAIYLAKKRV